MSVSGKDERENEGIDGVESVNAETCKMRGNKRSMLIKLQELA